MRAIEIANIIEEFAPNHIQEGWDNSGFCIGDPMRDVKGVILGLDCTPELIDEAIEQGVGMIITHHPLIFKGVKRITYGSSIERMIAKLIKNDIVLYSVHTNIDKVINGVSGLLADRLRLVNREILSEEGDSGYGLGVIGDLMEPIKFERVAELIKNSLGVERFKSSKPVAEPIKRVAVCGGSGGSLIEKAREEGAQLYISGDISYHNFFCEDGFMVADIGHYESEIGILEIIASILRKNLPNFAVRISVKNNNPIHYY